MATQKLTDKTIKATAFSGKPTKVSDGAGLHLLITSTGKYWRYSYRFEKRQKTLALGVYPKVSLKKAREEHQKAVKLLGNSLDPSDQRKTERQFSNSDHSFEAVAREWLSKQTNWAHSHLVKVEGRLKKDVFPRIGKKPINSFKTIDLLPLLYAIEERGAIDTAHRVRTNLGQVFRYAIQTGRAEHNPVADTKGALKPAKSKQYPFISDPVKIGEMMTAIDGYEGNFCCQIALRLAPLLMVRPGELRCAEWNEFDLKAARWIIPAERMKGRVKHIVPLSKQAVSLFKEIYQYSGHGRLIFPGARSDERPISDNTLNGALRRLGYSKDEQVVHGFRHMASTILNEHKGFDPDLIESQLAHSDGSMRGKYNNAQYIDKRAVMLQWWADWLDSLRIKVEG